MSEFENPLCADYALELWFPPAHDEDPTGPDSDYHDVAKMVCSVCKHVSECLSENVEEKYGVWGGTTPSERRRGTVRPSKRLMNRAAFGELPPSKTLGLPTHVNIKKVRTALKKVTNKRS